MFFFFHCFKLNVIFAITFIFPVFTHYKSYAKQNSFWQIWWASCSTYGLVLGTSNSFVYSNTVVIGSLHVDVMWPQYYKTDFDSAGGIKSGFVLIIIFTAEFQASDNRKNQTLIKKTIIYFLFAKLQKSCKSRDCDYFYTKIGEKGWSTVANDQNRCSSQQQFNIQLFLTAIVPLVAKYTDIDVTKWKTDE